MLRRTLIVGSMVALYGACRRQFNLPKGDESLLSPEDERLKNGGQFKACEWAEPSQSAGEQPECDVTAETAPVFGEELGADSTAADPVVSSSGSSSTLLAGLKVAIDVGHSANGTDRGAFGPGVSEYSLNVLESNLVARQLRAKGAFVSLFHYPNTTDLDERGRNAAGHHVFLSIHHNAFSNRSTQGTEVLVNHPDHSSEDQKLATSLQSKLVSAVWGSGSNKILDRGAKAQSLAVLRHTPKSVKACCLSEAFFITETGMSQAKANALVQKAAVAIAQGIENYWLRSSGSLALLHSESATNDSFEPWPLSYSDDDESELYLGH